MYVYLNCVSILPLESIDANLKAEVEWSIPPLSNVAVDMVFIFPC